jgi:hypothetical protein
MMTAREARAGAVARLAAIAGYDERFSVQRTLGRGKQSIDVLIRQALRASRNDELLLSEVRELSAVALGRAEALDDTIHAGGLPEATQVQFTVEEVEEAFAIGWGDAHAS